MHMCAHANTGTTHTHEHSRVRTRARTHALTHAHADAHTRTSTHAHKHSHTHAHTRTHTRARAHTHEHTCTHTHARTRTRRQPKTWHPARTRLAHACAQTAGLDPRHDGATTAVVRLHWSACTASALYASAVVMPILQAIDPRPALKMHLKMRKMGYAAPDSLWRDVCPIRVARSLPLRSRSAEARVVFEGKGTGLTPPPSALGLGRAEFYGRHTRAGTGLTPPTSAPGLHAAPQVRERGRADVRHAAQDAGVQCDSGARL